MKIPQADSISFREPSDLAAMAARVRAFVIDKVIPYESDPRWTGHGPTDELRRELNAAAGEAGVFAPHVPREFGGHGLSHVGKSIVFEAAGYSILGPVALHCAAPDEGNVHLLDAVARDAQRARWLAPIASGAARSCFCVTEPAPGAGSDPSQLQTTAVPDGRDYIINGRKWLITGAKGASIAIIMAKIVGGDADQRATLFLADMDNPGIRIERLIDGMTSSFVGGHAVVAFENLRIPADAVLGEVGAGYRYAQIRLAPARLTHCMRWLGSAVRAHDIACGYASSRTAFGRTIGEHGAITAMLADNAMDIHLARLVVRHAAWLLDTGHPAGTESSMAKVICSEAIFRIADRCVQILGGLGTTGDTVVERIFREVRVFRVYDGPSEVHRWSIGRKILKERTPGAAST